MEIELSGSSKIKTSEPDFEDIKTFSCSYKPIFKRIEIEGDLQYVYNAFHNLQKDTGELTDFNTKILDFDLQHPVDITVQPSYDGTVNLILNDDKNPPRLINSRFTVLENKRYRRIDRKGTNDTNIYKENFLDINTRLFKTTNKIPYIKFQGLSEGGSLKCGNYSFYFKYADSDTNETDFICETGLIPVYIGNINDPKSIRGGSQDEISDKIINLKLYNLDESYEYINIYYTRKTSDLSGNIMEYAYKISNSKQIFGSEISLSINGFEPVEEIDLNDINQYYNIIDKVKTQAQAQNTLFFANVDTKEIQYAELADLLLRITPSTTNPNNIGLLDHNYEPELNLSDLSKKNGYYDAKNVYDYTGYWDKEIYRFGVFCIMKNDTLSPVFDIRGCDELQSTTTFTNFPIYENGKRKIISFDNDYFINSSSSSAKLENVKGVCRLMHEQTILNKDDKGINPVGIKFHLSSELLDELSKHVKGICFVRQKRIPTILAQGITIGIDGGSNLPMLYGAIGGKGGQFFTESFLNSERELVHDFNSRAIIQTNAKFNALLCPEALFKSNEFGSLFTGSNFNLSKSRLNWSSDRSFFSKDNNDPRHFYISDYDSSTSPKTDLLKDIKLTMIDGGMPTKYSGTKYFSSRAGIAEELSQFSFIGVENKTKSARNLVRGVYTGYIGMENAKATADAGSGIYDIHTPGYNIENIKDYFMVRFNSLNPYYAISDRFDINLMKGSLQQYGDTILVQNKTDNIINSYDITCYRGDCYISNVTIRIMRNFQDPSVPINDTILDTKGWKANYNGYLANGALDSANLAKINRSDVNAVRIGHWATFLVTSNINMCYRTIDDSNSNEYALTGNPKSFYPYSNLNVRGSGKISDSYVYNSGYNSSVNSKTYHIVPNVPYINTIFSNRIMYSDIGVDNSFKNGYRVFQGLTYKDLTSQYGSITKIIEMQGDLIIVFENGVGMLPVNERTLIAGSYGGDVFIDSPNVINKVIKVLSSNYGCSFNEGILPTTSYVYGFDVEAKKIWRANTNEFEVLSDFKLQKFLNDNITLSERDKYIDISKLNVKIHYNAFKQDVIFIFYNNIGETDEKRFAITFNEQLNKFVSFNSWYPSFSDNINNIFFSTSLDELLNVTNKAKEYDQKYKDNLDVKIDDITKPFIEWYPSFVDYLSNEDRIYIYKHGQAGIFDGDTVNGRPLPCKWYGDQYPFEFEFIVAEEPMKHKIFDNLIILSNNAEPDSFTFEVIGDTYDFDKELNAHDYSISKGYNIVKKNSPINELDSYIDAYKTTIQKDKVTTIQKGIDIKKCKKRRLGNMQYLEDTWRVEIKPSRFNFMNSIKNTIDNMTELSPPLTFNTKETRIRDKYCRIRVKYTGEKLSIITALNTLYSDSFA